MNGTPLLLLLLALMVNSGCHKKEMPVYSAHSGLLQWHGRTLPDKDGNRQLISSSSYLKFRFTGDQCTIWLKNAAQGDDYNYVSIVLDGLHLERKPIRFDTFSPLVIHAVSKTSYHDIEFYKETEAVNGLIVIRSIVADSLLNMPEEKRKKIEFIGNSITVGMSSDTSMIPCMAGLWYDQHNAYAAYGPRVARALDLDYVVSGVSGIGIYRNWNTDGPTMPEVYDQAYMKSGPYDKPWDFSTFVPGLVCINLGTNDFSDGDGVTPRLPFNSTRFINAYVNFLGKIHDHYPDAGIVLINSPMVGEGRVDLLNACLLAVKEKVEKTIHLRNPVSIFTFTNFRGGGCGGHPSVEDQERMAHELIPFIKKLIDQE